LRAYKTFLVVATATRLLSSFLAKGLFVCKFTPSRTVHQGRPLAEKTLELEHSAFSDGGL